MHFSPNLVTYVNTFLLQTLLAMAYSTIGTISLLVVFSILASIAALLLPIEIRGRAMKVNNHYSTLFISLCYCSLTGFWWMTAQRNIQYMN